MNKIHEFLTFHSNDERESRFTLKKRSQNRGESNYEKLYSFQRRLNFYAFGEQKYLYDVKSFSKITN